ncbi:putative spermidine/putrescine transport system permease protein [Faunimonas pinastri]|uniref:Putative spermidine/putrescine transport system permease protein n=1 Tax=Faunimonas pinastri TaxID=1855383 RepID=A0A1H9C1R0_9HYPH|nr:ABC transporter permease [Faunimonas pinastri]SEP94743.1 putative spermidine/putrescine transport system permease protein [Faunimonas pinastri]
MSMVRRIDWSFFALLAFVVVFFVFMLAPILVVVIVSFTSAGFIAFPVPGWSTKWFAHIFQYKPFVDALIVSIEIAIGATILAGLLGVPACLFLARSRSRWAGAVMTFLLSPLSMPMIVIGFASLFFLSFLGFGVSFAALLITHTVVCLPYLVRTVAGVYAGLPRSYEESASILGAGPLRVFWHVTLPLIRPGIMAGSLFSFLTSFDNLPISYFFGSASTNTLPVVMLSYMENQFDPTIAALSTLQMALAVVGLIVVDRIYGIDKMTVAA